ncbi:MAG: chlorophyllase/cutinase-like alpha/beta fold protein [Chloroflexota bacterium]
MPPRCLLRVILIGLVALAVGCARPTATGQRGAAPASGGGTVGQTGIPDFGPALAAIGADASTPSPGAVARAASRGATVARPPEQPSAGPGGRDYPYQNVVWHAYGRGATAYFLFEPAGPSPASASVVVFLHGWLATTPTVYWNWIRHLARKGSIVIFPIYQQPLSLPSAFTANALSAEESALAELRRPGHVSARLDRIEIIGHSVGAVVAFNLAAEAASHGLPTPKALLTVEPGGLEGTGPAWNAVPMADPRAIPASTYYLTLVGDRDTIVGDADAIRLWNAIPQIPSGRRDIVEVVTDLHGSPALVADHFMPCAGSGLLFSWMTATNADDYDATWKLSVALANAAFEHRDVGYALGGTPEQRFMGVWSDGTPVKSLLITENPGDLGPDPAGPAGGLPGV